jgi:hypothetical protein
MTQAPLPRPPPALEHELESAHLREAAGREEQPTVGKHVRSGAWPALPTGPETAFAPVNPDEPILGRRLRRA